MMNREEERVKKYIQTCKMIADGDVVAAGVSGGADSVCLLFMLCDLQEELGFRLKVCHVNHGLRGAESDGDEAYVAGLCARLGVPCRIFRENVELIAGKRKQSLEEAGREVRLDAFAVMCAEEGCTRIATAHHMDDNAETVLFHAVRGTGLRGLAGIRPVAGNRIRPLLILAREETEGYLRRRGIVWREDRTNQEDCYTRNRIRRHIMPMLKEQVNAGAARHLSELSAQAADVWDYLEHGVDLAWSRCVCTEARTGDAALRIRGDLFREEMPAVRRQLLLRCMIALAGSGRDVSAVHVRETESLFDMQTGKYLCLPGGVRAERTSEGIRLRREEHSRTGREKRSGRERGAGSGIRDADAAGDTAAERETFLCVPGTTEIPGTGYAVCCSFPENADLQGAKEFPQKSYTKWIDYDIIKGRLSVRTRRPGDFLTVDRSGSRKKLKEYFINEKIPRSERETLPLVADGSHIVWIPGKRMSAAYQVSEGTARILEIKITEEKKNG